MGAADEPNKPNKCRGCGKVYGCHQYLVLHMEGCKNAKQLVTDSSDGSESDAEDTEKDTPGNGERSKSTADEFDNLNETMDVQKNIESFGEATACQRKRMEDDGNMDSVMVQISDSHNVLRTVTKRDTTKERSYKCYICTKRVSSLKALFRHIKAHSGEKPFKCQICRRKFSRIDSLRRHIKIHEKNSNGLSNHGLLKTRRKKYHLDENEEIEMKEKKINKIELNKETIMESDTIEKNQVAEVKPSEESLIKEVQREPAVVNEPQNSAVRHDESSHICEVCGKKFYSSYNVSRHMAAVHSDENRPFQCLLCPRRFKRQAELTKHVRCNHNVAKEVIDETAMETNIEEKNMTDGLLAEDAEEDAEESDVEEESDENYDLDCAAEEEERRHIVERSENNFKENKAIENIDRTSYNDEGDGRSTFEESIKEEPQDDGEIDSEGVKQMNLDEFPDEDMLKYTVNNDDNISVDEENSATAHSITFRYPNKTKELSFKCPLCGKTFQSSWRLKIHTASHSRRGSDIHQCYICKEIFSSTSEQEHHFCIKSKTNISENETSRIQDIEDQEIILKFETDEREEEKINVHALGETPLKEVSFNDYLKNNIPVSLSTKPVAGTVVTKCRGEYVSCEVCNKQLLRKSIKKHMLLHKEATHECSICQSKFPRSDYLRNHIRKTHQMD